jgi:hypothetical protein
MLASSQHGGDRLVVGSNTVVRTHTLSCGGCAQRDHFAPVE